MSVWIWFFKPVDFSQYGLSLMDLILITTKQHVPGPAAAHETRIYLSAMSHETRVYAGTVPLYIWCFWDGSGIALQYCKVTTITLDFTSERGSQIQNPSSPPALRKRSHNFFSSVAGSVCQTRHHGYGSGHTATI